MRHLPRRMIGWLALSCAIGCGRLEFDVKPDDPATLGTPESAAYWAASSAPRLVQLVELPYLAATLYLDLNSDTCPVRTVDGTTTTVTGGCTDAGGRQWKGTAIVVDEPDRSGSFTYDGFGFDGTEDCMGTSYPSFLSTTGGMTMVRSGQRGTFEIDLALSSEGVSESDCTARSDTQEVSYDGTVLATGVDGDGDGELDDQLYDGAGTVRSRANGVASAKTDSELLSSVVCMDEAASGTTTVEAGGHSMTIHYDGATDCDPESTVTWSYDGVDQGELSKVDCSSGRGLGGASALLWIAAAAIATRRRRGSSS
jgi:hypothetical protein